MLQKIWYQKHFAAYLLFPFSWLYRAIVAMRQLLFRLRLKKTTHFPVPIIVVGNITVGGTGKTPLVVALAKRLCEQGLQPGLVSRGYGGKAKQWPQAVTRNSDPGQVGDEAVLLVHKTGCPMVVSPDRVAAVKQLLAQNTCDVVISDDGLQHTALGRDFEIAVLDGERRLGNGFCLPAGPLREPAVRLKKVSCVVVNGDAKSNEIAMQLVPTHLINVKDPSRELSVDQLYGKQLHAVAGIGNPGRFFKTLKSLNLLVTPHAFPDHHKFQKRDINFGESWVLMTEKDAVKCVSFADERHWYLPVEAALPDAFWQQLETAIKHG